MRHAVIHRALGLQIPAPFQTLSGRAFPSNCLFSTASSPAPEIKIRYVQRAAFPISVFMSSRDAVKQNGPFFSIAIHPQPKPGPSAHDMQGASYQVKKVAAYRPDYLPRIITRGTFERRWSGPLRAKELAMQDSGSPTQPMFGPSRLDRESLPSDAGAQDADKIRFGVPATLLTGSKHTSSTHELELLRLRQLEAIAEAESRVLRVIAIVGKKTVHKHAVTRQKCKTRCVWALRRIIELDNDPRNREGPRDINTKVKRLAGEWARQGHVLVLYPSLAALTTPIEELVKAMRESLSHLVDKFERPTKSSRGSHTFRKPMKPRK